MRHALCFLALACAACGSPPPPHTPGSLPTEGPGSLLNEDECEDLAQWIVAACHDRGNDRSSKTEGWCSDIQQRTLPGDSSWIHECKHRITHVDDACFRGSRIVGSLMDCDAAVSH
jgi:hypothetical protein